MFEVTGLKNGKQYSVRMTEGKLSGDKTMVSRVQSAALEDHGILGLPPCTKPAGRYLENECSASELAQLCFDEVLSTSDDWAPADASDAVY
jgi:hypothetical protein